MIKIITILITISGLILVLYMLFGKNQKPWSEMTQNEKNKKKMAITGGTLVFLAGMLSLLNRKK